MGDQCCRACSKNPEESARRRWHQPTQLLSSGAAAGDLRSRSVDTAGPSAGEPPSGDVVSARMRLLYDYRAPAGTRWSPTAEQLRELLALFHIGGVRTPSTAQISRITARLRAHGRIEGRNVFYWFQNQKARERKRRLQLLQQKASSSPAQDHANQLVGQAPQPAPRRDGHLQDGDSEEVHTTRNLWPRSHLHNFEQSRSPSSSADAEMPHTSYTEELPEMAGLGCELDSSSDLVRHAAMRARGMPMAVLDVTRAAVEEEKSEVSDAANNIAIVQHRPVAPPLSRYTYHADHHHHHLREAHSSAANAGRFQDFDEIDSVTDLATPHLPPLYSPSSSSIIFPATAPTLPLFPLSPTTSSSTAMEPRSSESFFQFLCPTSLSLHGHPQYEGLSAPPAVPRSKHDTVLELKLAINL